MPGASWKEVFQKPVAFGDLSLADIPLTEVRPKKDEKSGTIIRKNFQAEVSCFLKQKGTGKKVNGKLTVELQERREKSNGPVTRETVRVALKNKGTDIRLTLEILHGRTGALVTTDVARHIENKGRIQLPRGTGIALYEKGLDYIQARAQVSGGKVFTHMVEREEMTTTETSLSREQWENLFLPVLEARGYKETDDNKWEKEYSSGGLSENP